MSLQRTEHLMKALALDYLHNKQFNMGVLQLLCEQQKVHASTSEQQVIKKVSVIDKGFELLKQQMMEKVQSKKGSNKKGLNNIMQRNLHNMVSAFLFNVSAINEHYIQQIQDHMVESTASQSFTNNDMMNKTLQKDKMAVGLLKQQLSKYFYQYTQRSIYLKEIVQQLSQREDKQLKQGELGLLETVDYLCVKYSVNNHIAQKIVQILEKHQPNTQEQNISQFHFSQKAKHINQMLFTQPKQQELFNILQSNPHVNFKHILLLINANYLSTNGKRKIFTTSSRQGKQVIQMLMVKMIKRIGKLQLFTQKNQQYGPFRLLLMHFLNKYFPVYWEFTQIIKSLIYSNQAITSESNFNMIKKIEQFFRVFITLEHPHFQQLLRFTFGILANKYSQPVGMDLIKKLLLNRFLLNPSFFILYHDPTQQQIKKFIQTANIIRTLFYPNKTQQLAAKLNQSQFIKISSDILYSLQYCLKKQKDSKIINNNFLYVNDKIIKATMLELYEDLKQQPKITTPRQPINIQNLASDYSLSFSIVKNQLPTKNILSRPIIDNVSEVKLASNTNRTNTKDNQSIRYMYDQLKGQKSQSQFPPKSPQKKPPSIYRTQNKQEKFQKQKTQNLSNLGKVSQMTRKQHEITNQTRLNTFNLPTDRQIIEQLVELRKQYGQRKKLMKSQYEAIRVKSVKRITILNSFSVKFNQFKSQIQKDNDTLYVHMTSIA